ncbi:MAG: hypothetical protein ACPGJU_09250 [Coraliomargarita sp.]
MKTLFKLFLFFCLLVVIALVAGYFVITNPGFQKGLVEDQLPAGSSIEYVQVTPSSFEVRGLKLKAEDGTYIEVGTASSEFSPLAAWRSQTIKLGELVVSGVNVNLPEPDTSAGSAGGGDTKPTSSPESSSPSSAVSSESVEPESPSESEQADPFEAIYQLGELDWLFDIERIQVDGELNDGQGGNYAFSMESSAIAPSLESTVQIKLDSAFDQVQPNGVKAFSGAVELSFSQKVTGGFERFQLNIDASAQDASGGNLLSLRQGTVLDIQSNAQTAGAKISFNADVPEPGRFMPELTQIGALKVDGKADASLSGQTMTLSEADLSVTAGGQPIVALDLKKTLTLGGTQNLEGELLDLSLMNLPMAWLSPWMPEGLAISAQPLSMALSVSGEGDGSMIVAFKQPIQLAELSITQGSQPMIDQVNFSVHPLLTVKADQSLYYRLDELKLDDRYGTFLSGNVSGTIPAELSEDRNLPDGLSANADLAVKLQPLMQQPALKGMTSIMSGSLSLDLDVDASKDYPIQLQSSIQSLRARGMPGTSQNYRFAAQAKQPSADTWLFGVNLMAGNDSRPSTNAQLSGSVSPDKVPMAFELDLKSERIRQSDMELLAAAFSPSGESTSVTTSEPTPSPSQPRTTPRRPQTTPPQPSSVSVSSPPAWAGLDGKVNVDIGLVELNSRQKIENLTAKVRVSEPLLDVSDLSAAFGEGTFGGSARVEYAADSADAYALKANLDVKQFDPAIFADPRSGKFPISGRFDTNVRVQGEGATLEDALDKSDSALLITGKDGVLTAFELDQRKSQFLGLMGIAGHYAERPGITAMSNVVPYFKDIRFSDLVVSISRGLDRRVVISQLDVVGEHLLLEGKGSVDPTTWKDIVNKPMDLNLALGSRGKLAEYVDTLNLLQEETAENGFNYWNRELRIQGTLSNPDTSVIMDLLKDAAASALRDPEDEPADNKGTNEDTKFQEQSEKAEEEKKADEVDIAIDVLNSLFGN